MPPGPHPGRACGAKPSGCRPLRPLTGPGQGRAAGWHRSGPPEPPSSKWLSNHQPPPPTPPTAPRPRGLSDRPSLICHLEGMHASTIPYTAISYKANRAAGEASSHKALTILARRWWRVSDGRVKAAPKASGTCWGSTRQAMPGGGGDDVKERKGNVHGRPRDGKLSQPVSSPSSTRDATFWGAARTSLPCQPVRLPTVPVAGAV